MGSLFFTYVLETHVTVFVNGFPVTLFILVEVTSTKAINGQQKTREIRGFNSFVD
jgi:hypothetical protein